VRSSMCSVDALAGRVHRVDHRASLHSAPSGSARRGKRLHVRVVTAVLAFGLLRGAQRSHGEESVRHEARDPEFEARVRASFARQRFMSTLGASLERVAPGEVVIAFTHRDVLTQQHGYLHAGVMTSVVDSACGYAALSLTEPGVGVLSVEFKVNMLAPAIGERFVATGRVVRAGRTLTVCSGEVTTDRDGATVAVLLMQATMMSVRGREGVAD